MTKRKSTKRALLLSALSLLMCVSMLIGATFAWFTDSVTSGGNKIQAGNLKVDLELYDKVKGFQSIKENQDPIFTYANWEPGYVDAKLLKVENEGSLALKWKAAFVSDTELGILADVIDVFVKPGVTVEEFNALTREDLATWTNAGTVRQFLGGIESSTYGTLEAKQSATLGIALKMRETAGNEYMNETIDAFDIMILATQLTSENDSYDNQYDKDAQYPSRSTVVSVPANATQPISLETNSGASVTIPAALLNALPDEVTALQFVHDEPKMTESGYLTLGYMDILDQDGNKVDLAALQNSEAIEVTLPVGDNYPADMIVEIYHDHVKVAEATVAADKTITYEANHFCYVTVSEKVFIEVTFTDGYTKRFTSLAKAMRYGYSGGEQEKITVYQDIAEPMDFLEGNIVCGKEGGVTIKNTIYDAWIYCDYTNFTIGEDVTYDATGYNSGLFLYGDNCVVNGTLLTDCYYQRYGDTKLTINAPGSMSVKTETFILRLTDNDPNAGIYINGDNNDETVELQLAVAYFYQGMISAKDATLLVSTYWQTNETDGQGSANLILDNSKLTVTVNEHDFKATGNSFVTLKNGSVLNVAGGIVATNEIVVDATSVVNKAR